MTSKRIKITERGWAGHFFCADLCQFRRNTLIEYGRKKIIVSTVGMKMITRNDKREYDTIGANGRYYETMAFKAKKEGPYWDIEVSEQLSFDSEWAICAKSVKELPKNADNIANDMHEKVVKELSRKLIKGKI